MPRIRTTVGSPTPFLGGYPSKESIQQLMDGLVFRRAVQTYLWHSRC